MVNVVVAFPKIENGRKIRNALTRSGIDVTAVCTKGSQVIMNVADNPDSIVVTSFRLADMLYRELREYLPRECKMLVITSQKNEGEIWEKDVDVMLMPLKLVKLVRYVEDARNELHERQRQQKRRLHTRSAEEKSLIDEAKQLLQIHNGLTEAEAHSYLQKRSMDSGLNLVEMSRMIIDSYEIYE